MYKQENKMNKRHKTDVRNFIARYAEERICEAWSAFKYVLWSSNTQVSLDNSLYTQKITSKDLCLIAITPKSIYAVICVCMSK